MSMDHFYATSLTPLLPFPTGSCTLSYGYMTPADPSSTPLATWRDFEMLWQIGRVAERSKVSGTSHHFGGVGSNPTTATFFTCSQFLALITGKYYIHQLAKENQRLINGQGTEVLLIASAPPQSSHIQMMEWWKKFPIWPLERILHQPSVYVPHWWAQ